MPVKLNGSTSGSVTIDAPAVAGTNTLTLPAVTDTLVGLAATQTLTNKSVSLAAGTTSVAPFNLTSGTNLTTATAGAVEYDGTVFYATPTASQRGVITAEQIILNNGLNKSAVIAGVGTREYYKNKCGYHLEGTYMIKTLKKSNNLKIYLYILFFILLYFYYIFY